MEPKRIFCLTRALILRKSLEILLRRAFNWLKWMNLIPENLERLISAQVRSYVAKLSHLYIADNKHLFSIFFSIFSKFSVKGFKSNLVLEGEDSKSNYDPSSFFLDGKSLRSYVLLCIFLYHPNKLTFLSFLFMQQFLLVFSTVKTLIETF